MEILTNPQIPSITSVTAPILRVLDEGTLGAKKHLEEHLDKLLEGNGVKPYTFGWFQAT
jgi:hypothetical protein